MACNQLDGFFKPGRLLPLEIREEIVDLYNAGDMSAGQQLYSIISNMERLSRVSLGLSQETERLKGKAELSKPLETVYMVLPFPLICLDVKQKQIFLLPSSHPTF